MAGLARRALAGMTAGARAAGDMILRCVHKMHSCCAAVSCVHSGE